MPAFLKKTLLASFISSAFLLTACGGSDSNNDNNSPDGTDQTMSADLPEGLTLTFVDASTPKYIRFDSSTDKTTDLNDVAAASGESSIQKMAISDTSTIGSFFHWPDFKMKEGEALLDGKYVLMKPDYVAGSAISSEDFVQLVHFHDTDLAAHSADEFANPEAGSAKEAGLMRLNNHVTAQAELVTEVTEFLAEAATGETFCQAYIDPYQKFEHDHEQEEQTADTEATQDEPHEHAELVHFALTKSGRMYFAKEDETEEKLTALQPFVTLEGVSTIDSCARVTIARTSEKGVLVFIPDTQKLYLVDSHGSDFHQHSTWNVSDFLPEGFRADLMAVIGEGEGHEHEEGDEHDHE